MPPAKFFPTASVHQPGLAPPSDAAIEAAVLGAMLLEAPAVGTALAMLRGNAEVFYQPGHQAVFTAVGELHRLGLAIDQLTVVDQLRSTGKLSAAGGIGAVARLTMNINGAGHLATHCLTLLQLYVKRRIGQVGYLFTQNAYNDLSDPLQLIGEAQQAINSLHEAIQLRRARTLGELFNSAVDEVVEAAGAAGGLTGVPTRLAALDNVTGGWQPGNLIIVAARPGMGKTSFTLACAVKAQPTHPGAFFSLEMGAMELVKKTIATSAGYSTSQLTRGVGMSVDEAEYLRHRARELADSGLLIDDTPAISIGELRAKVAKAVAEQGIKVAYIDYLQLMAGEKSGNREQEIGSISRGLKLIAKENGIPVIALAQLSRAVETRGGDKKPQLSDLRESGSIEQDADVVIFLYRPEYYKITQDEMGNSTEGLTEVLIQKHRNGATKDVVVQSDMRTGRYSDLATDAPVEVAARTALPASQFDNERPF